MGLAGPRDKQRIGKDPRNLKWSNDHTKFGSRMLSKMGWAPGEGLGAQGQGVTSHVSVRLKDNNLGIGATKKTIDNWLDNTDAFTALLQNLNERVQEEEENQPVGDEKEQRKKEKKRAKEEKKKEKSERKESKKSKKSKKSNDNDVSEQSTSTVADPAVKTTEFVPNARLYHRTKFLRQKKAAMNDSARLAEILGVKDTSNAVQATMMCPNVEVPEVEEKLRESGENKQKLSSKRKADEEDSSSDDTEKKAKKSKKRKTKEDGEDEKKKKKREKKETKAKKARKSATEDTHDDSSESTKQKQKSSSTGVSGLTTTVAPMNLQQYFAQKMSGMKLSGLAGSTLL